MASRELIPLPTRLSLSTEKAVASRAHSRNGHCCNWADKIPATIASPAPTVLCTAMSGGCATTASAAGQNRRPLSPSMTATSSTPRAITSRAARQRVRIWKRSPNERFEFVNVRAWITLRRGAGGGRAEMSRRWYRAELFSAAAQLRDQVAINRRLDIRRQTAREDEPIGLQLGDPLPQHREIVRRW